MTPQEAVTSPGPDRPLPTGANLAERLDQLADHADYNEWEETARTVRGAKAEIEALRAVLEEAYSGLVAHTGGTEGACAETVKRIDVLLTT